MPITGDYGEVALMDIVAELLYEKVDAQTEAVWAIAEMFRIVCLGRGIVVHTQN